MDGEAKQDASCSIKKTIRCSIKTSWRCFSEHWALFSLGLLLYLLYKSSPGFFAFLLSTSPVIICTILLLGVLLSCGSAHLPEIHEDGNAPEKISAPEFGGSSRNVHIKLQQKRFPVATLKENIIRESSFGRRGCGIHADLDENVPFLKQVHQGDERLEKVRTYVPSLKQDVAVEEYMKTNAENESEDAFLSKDKGDEHANLFDDVHHSKVDVKETDQGRVPTDEQSSELADVSEHKAADGSAGKCKWGRAFSVRRRKKLADIKIEAINPAGDNQSDHPLCSPFTRVGSHDNSSGFDHGNAEGHSPDAPMIDISRALDETEMGPPPGAGCSCPDRITNDDPYNHSSISSLGSQPESDSNEVADNSKAKDDGEQKEDDGAEPAFLWTGDDDKNVMDLGYSETERYRRLEVLMVRRKSRKNIVFELDGTGGQVQPLSISARRTNPFAEDPEIPGSAPPALHPRKNPFDFLTEQQPDDGGGFPAPPPHDVEPQEPMPAPHQDALFRRHESFTFGRPPQGQGGRRFKPCFVLEEFGGSDEASAPGGYGFQRQFSDRSVSRLSAVSECDTVSSVGDQEHNELIRSYIRGVRESPSPSPLGQEQDGDDDVRPVGNECSDGIGFVDGEALNAAIC